MPHCRAAISIAFSNPGVAAVRMTHDGLGMSRSVIGAGLVAVQGEHLAHASAWAVQRADMVETLLAIPCTPPSMEEMLQSALKYAARQMAANRHQ